MSPAPNIGVLALQGAVSEHLEMLRHLGAPCREVRYAEALEGLDGLLIPGGESTTLEKLVRRFGIDRALVAHVERGMAVWGTCAGMILLAQEIDGAGPGQTGLGLFPIRVQRNAFGRQRASCEVDLRVAHFGTDPFPAVFIRAPVASDVLDPEVETLATHQGEAVALSYKRLLATSFHPELTGDTRWHESFLALAAKK